MTDADAEYEAGDINRVDDADEDEDYDDLDDEVETVGGGNRAEGAIASAVLTHLATSIADEP